MVLPWTEYELWCELYVSRSKGNKKTWTCGADIYRNNFLFWFSNHEPKLWIGEETICSIDHHGNYLRLHIPTSHEVNVPFKHIEIKDNILTSPKPKPCKILAWLWFPWKIYLAYFLSKLTLSSHLYPFIHLSTDVLRVRSTFPFPFHRVSPLFFLQKTYDSRDTWKSTQ